MLILTRRVGESIRIGDNIEVMIVGFQKNEIRVGISAPKEIPVHREEIYQKIQKEKAKATDLMENSNAPSKPEEP